MLAIIGSAALLVAASVLVGRCLLRMLGIEGPAPAVGLAVLVVLTDATFSIGGEGAVAATVMGVAIAIALIAEILDRPRPAMTVLAGFVASGALALAVGLIPFLANGRPGTLGVSILNDLAIHEYWAWALDTGQLYHGLIFPGYPLGAHAVVAALVELTGANAERGFSALLIATPCLTALTAFAAFDRTRIWLRSIGSCVAAFPYLGAAFLGEGSFKEPMVVLLVLGTALSLRSLLRAPDRLVARCSALGVLIAGVALIEGGPGLAWPGLTIVVWAVCELVPRRARIRELARAALVPIAVGAVTTVILVSPELGALLAFAPGGLLGSNLPSFLPFGESMGLWFAPDFRLGHSAVLPGTTIDIIGLALLAYACWWWYRRRDLALPSAAVSALLVALYVHHRETAYLTAKAQMIFGGLYMVTVVGALLDLLPTTAAVREVLRGRRSHLVAAGGMAGTVVLVGFVIGVARSDSLSLRNAVVDSDAPADALAPIRARVLGQPTLMLVTADFAPWELRGARQAVITPYGVADRETVTLDLDSPVPTSGTATGFASVTSATLDEFRYAVTTSSAYASSAPPNWRLVMRTGGYDLWRRSGATPTMNAVPGSAGPISQLQCSAVAVRSRLAGSDAVVRPAPVIGATTSWRLRDGAGMPVTPSFAVVGSGDTVSQTVTLPAGQWNLSLPYQSVVPITVTIGDRTTTLPPNLDVFGSYWTIGDLRSPGGPVTVSVHLDSRPFPGTQAFEPIGPLAAVRTDVSPRRIAAKRACGRWVDWLTGPSSG